MKDRVDFLWGPPGADGRSMPGYTGSVCPIDKCAELVLSSKENPIHELVLRYADETEVVVVVTGILKNDRMFDADWKEVDAWPPRRNKWADQS